MASFMLQLGRKVPTSTSFAGSRGIRALLPSFGLLHKSIQPTATPSTTSSYSTRTPTDSIPNKHSSTSAIMSSKAFLETIKNRRTYYALKKESPISDAQIQEIIKEAILHVPSSFNSQSTRVVLLVKEEHNKLWEITKGILQAIVPKEQWAGTEQKLNGFKAAYGTVLFYESRSVVSGMQEAFAAYADRFPGWATQSDAMHQFTIWTALEAEGLGASLQHYNPLIDQNVAATWGIDDDWVLNAQLVFGKPDGEAGDKTFLPVEDRFKSFGV
ncbi:hypothetical protein VTL71DRAFT_3747 [Oculimacula yallundae]|uniref:Nitroreductase domain-containing protein n=1 Tax=Oculimacula yallundae TaxID=86028 RepID=A0ABR4C3X2_9HELO